MGSTVDIGKTAKYLLSNLSFVACPQGVCVSNGLSESFLVCLICFRIRVSKRTIYSIEVQVSFSGHSRVVWLVRLPFLVRFGTKSHEWIYLHVMVKTAPCSRTPVSPKASLQSLPGPTIDETGARSGWIAPKTPTI